MKETTFEKALSRVAEINEKLAEGEVPLDKSLELFKEAAELIAYCNGQLKLAKEKAAEYGKDILEQ